MMVTFVLYLYTYCVPIYAFVIPLLAAGVVRCAPYITRSTSTNRMRSILNRSLKLFTSTCLVMMQVLHCAL